MNILEYGKIIPDFPNYEVTNHGRVINILTERDMVLTPTMQGDLTVGLTRDRHQYRRSVKVLVARAFVEGEDEVYNTPIQLDGDKYNLHESNIEWRPRWFAWEYTRQFKNPPPWYYHGPVEDITNQVVYLSIMEAATLNGLLCNDIINSIIKDTRVFPSGAIYEFRK